MTTTADTQAARTCPPSATADAIVCWFEVEEGELVLFSGTLRRLVQMWPLTNLPGSQVGIQLLHDGETREFYVDSNALVAVRRYDLSDPEGGQE